MAKMSYREALTETLHQEMANDKNVIVMGEDVVGGTGSAGCLLYTSPSPRD